MSKKKAFCLAILGTGSDVGKSIVVTALCRIFKNQGIRVAPFKAQNMSNNSYITVDGGEMGRAQVVQAEAAGLEPRVDMNPVLLKPNSEVGSQVIVQGEIYGNSNAQDYHKNTDNLFKKSLESLERLRTQYELIILEGAGSCGEVNLRKSDFVNFKIAKAVEAPVVLVADISRGGVFAQIIGTLEVISEEEKKQIKGVIINHFRGHAELFSSGINYIERKIKKPILGLIPHFQNIKIEAEDGVALEQITDLKQPVDKGKINIAILRLPHISNYTDFEPLESEAMVFLHYLHQQKSLVDYDLVIIPGTKNTRGDLDWLESSGWSKQLQKYRDQGGQIGGICGGYQMLGKVIVDPNGVEGEPGRSTGLGFLAFETTLQKSKKRTRVEGVSIVGDKKITGYEIHMGKTRFLAQIPPLIKIIKLDGTLPQKVEGARSQDGKVWGTYLHGLFDQPEFRHYLLSGFKKKGQSFSTNPTAWSDFKNRQYDLLAEHFTQHLDLSNLAQILSLK
jgi:adenosylcobyric acid synthase